MGRCTALWPWGQQQGGVGPKEKWGEAAGRFSQIPPPPFPLLL